MKQTFYFLVGCMLTASVMFMQSCKKDDPNPDVRNYLQNTWTLGSQGYVMRDGVDRTDDYTNLSITFASNGTYTTQHAGKMLHASGTWSWQSNNSWTLLLDGDYPVEVKEINQTTLHIKFHLDPEDVNEEGRTNAVVGDYEILLTN